LSSLENLPFVPGEYENYIRWARKRTSGKWSDVASNRQPFQPTTRPTV